MATSDDSVNNSTTAPESATSADAAPNGSRPKRRATKKAAKKTATKSATKSAAKTAKTATKSAKKSVKKSAAKKTVKKSTKNDAAETVAQQSPPAPADVDASETVAESADDQAGGVTSTSGARTLLDRSTLGEKTRVFALSKELGIPSKELVAKLNELGMAKVAQSSLSRAETEQLLDALEQPSTPPPADDEKLRRRVRKNVENEIHQIEEKVDAELLTDIEPDITPAPEDSDPSTGLYAPVFKAPSRSSRRRASRPSEGADKSTDRADRAVRTPEPEPEHETTPTSTDDDTETIHEPKAIKGSSRLEAQRRRRTERREEERKRSRVVSQAEFLARRESVERTMVVRERDRHDGPGKITQVGVLEDGLLVEHFVDSDDSVSMVGNIYLGRVQNVLPSMEAAFIDIGQGRNGVLYAGEVDWKAAGLGGRSRRIEQALKSGDQVLVQVTKDPVGHKGARLSTQISLAGRFLVYVPGGRSAGISRKLPAPERKRLKDILVRVVPGKGGAIIRTAAEGASEEAIAADVGRLHSQWEAIQEQAEKEKNSKGAKPVTLYEEPKLLVRVIRDLFNEDFDALVVDGKKPWNVVQNYVQSVAPDLLDRVEKFDRSEHDGKDAFEVYRVDEQIQKALSRTVFLPSGGTLVIDRTEAMTVIDVNTGKFTGSGGSLEETVTSNNMEAAEEIVRQLRLRDIGGMIIVDFIDMILPENQELVLRRFKEALGRDRTRHQVSEVTSLGLVQLTRKRLGTGLVETFSTTCEHCGGRGIVLTDDPVDLSREHTDHPAQLDDDSDPRSNRRSRTRSKRRTPAQDPGSHPAAVAMQNRGSGERADLEELVDAVVISPDPDEPIDSVDPVEPVDTADTVDTADAVDTDTETGTDARDAEQDDRPQSRSRSSRRRGRRGSGRGRGRSQTNHAEEREHPAEPDAEDTGRATRSARNTDSAKSAEGAQTYEEAVAEFESSPRRKRSTRGNSRSDHRPRPEDFESHESRHTERFESAEPAEPETQEAADPREKSQSAGSSDRASRAGGRGRRRATRRTSESDARRAESPKTSSDEPKAALDDAPARPTQPTAARGRRRATRKRSG